MKFQVKYVYLEETMGLTKLTLTIDEQVVQKARAYTERHHTSISRLVNSFLDGLEEPAVQDYPPVVRRLMGVLPEAADETEYYRHLEEKYGT